MNTYFNEKRQIEIDYPILFPAGIRTLATKIQ